MLIIQNATFFASEGVPRRAELFLENGRILSIEPPRKEAPPAGSQVLDAAGWIVSPGWLDIQINGAFGLDFTNDPDSLWQVAARLPEFGTTAFLPTIITAPLEQVEKALRVWRAGPPPGWRGAVPLGLHLEGPFLNPGKKGAHDPRWMRTPKLAALQNWKPENGVRMVTLAPELPGALDVVHTLRARGVVVSAGHSLANYQQGMAAFDAGVNAGTHLFNAMSSLDHRAPGLVGALLDHTDPVVGMIVDGLHVHPAVVRLAWKCLEPQRLILVTDAMAALGMPPDTYQLGDQQVIVDGSTARLPDGTLAGSLLTQPEALRNLQKFTGCSLFQALQTITYNPANLLNLETKGSLRDGGDADLTLLSSAGEVMATIVAGEIIYRTPGLTLAS